MATKEEEIFTAIKSFLTSDLTWPRHIETENPFTDVSDLGNNEIPLVQVYWDKPSVQQQQRGLTTTTAPLIIEAVAKDTSINNMTQSKLFQYRVDILQAVSDNISLPGVPGFIHFAYTGRVYDIHTFQDWFIAKLSFNALFQETFGSC